ncbi:MAG TPA: deoxyribonuclease IV [Clostridia bacterium]|nr:MAG: putative endonuclease 4 [Firmicutes bacterium ADurb.Bin248]HOS19302.1 deoxyribonuclease IV [Clostridia bacterium]HPK14448.1 deoxyribonuclease IV [Clostridia bacterium]
MLFIGPHMSIAGGYAKAARDAAAIGATAFQFFSRNPRGSRFRKHDGEDEAAFQSLRRECGFGPLQAHAPYTLNLAASDERVYDFGKTVICEDVRRMDALKIEYLVLHPGSHTGAGTEAGAVRVASALAPALEGSGSITVLLETMAGGGTEIGASFAQLREIMDLTGHADRLGACMDLCHVYAAGYDVKNDLDGVLKRFDREIGLSRLKSVHLNDSMGALGSKRDRHAALGEGEIGMEAILNALEHPALRDLPFYTETPFDDEGHAQELATVRRLLAARAAGRGNQPSS